jgi:membrane-associated phospholipid phosphatase
MMKFILFLLCAISATQGAYAGRWSIESIGDMLAIAVPAYTMGAAIHENGWEGTVEFVESYIGSTLTAELLKRSIHETRPNRADNKSFPSGHAASAFAGATFMHARYGWRRAIIPYALAGFVGFSRIHSEWHYAHDIAAGAALAAAWSFLVAERYKTPVMLSVDADGFQLRGKIDF